MEPIQLTQSNEVQQSQPKSHRTQYTKEFKTAFVNEVRRRRQIDPTHSDWQQTQAVAKQMKVAASSAYNWVNGRRRIYGNRVHTNGVTMPKRKYRATPNQYSEAFKSAAVKKYNDTHEKGHMHSSDFAKWCRQNKVPKSTIYKWVSRDGVPESQIVEAEKQPSNAKQLVKETQAAYKAGLFPSIDAAFKHLLWRLDQ